MFVVIKPLNTIIILAIYISYNIINTTWSALCK